MNTRDTLLAAIHVDPDDLLAWRALADNLEEEGQGDRAELLRLHLKLTRAYDQPEAPLFQARAQSLLVAGVKPCVPQLSLSLGKESLVASLIPAGQARVGNDPPERRVRIDHPFYLAIFPTTQAQWFAVTGEKPSYFLGRHRPAEQTNYDDCLDFCARLSRMVDRQVRLPTEAEWEYACRAGTTSPYYSGSNSADLTRVAFRRSDHTHKVGKKLPNGWGLYDLHGNVWEWTCDADGPMPEDLSVDPRRDEDSPARVCKGGSYGNATRAGGRIGFMAGGRNTFIGSRVLIECR